MRIPQSTQSPRQRWKICLLLAVIVLQFLPQLQAQATASHTVPSGSLPTVVDQADLFTPEQEAGLSERAATIGAKHSQDLVIVTTDDAEGKIARDYADDFFDYGGYGFGEEFSGMLFLIDMDNREIWLSTTGHAIDVMTDERIDDLLDLAILPMQNANYAEAANVFLTQADHYLELGVPDGQYRIEEKVRALEAHEIVLTILIAGAGFAMFYFSVTRRYRKRRMTWNYDLSKMAIANFPIFSDRLVNKFVRTRKVPRQTSSGGGGGGSSTHTGSSGRSHGGGGRGF